MRTLLMLAILGIAFLANAPNSASAALNTGQEEAAALTIDSGQIAMIQDHSAISSANNSISAAASQAPDSNSVETGQPESEVADSAAPTKVASDKIQANAPFETTS